MGETAKSQSKEVKKKEVKKKETTTKAPAKAEKVSEKTKKDEKPEKKVEKKVKKAEEAKAEKVEKAPAKKDTKAKAPESKSTKTSSKTQEEASKKKKKEEKVKEPEPVEDDDPRTMQEGVVEMPAASSKKTSRPAGACAAEALDEEVPKNGRPTRSSKKLGQGDRSRSRDKGSKENKEEERVEKTEKAKVKDGKEKETGKSKEKAKGNKERCKESYSSEESSAGVARRRQKRREDAGLKAASGFSLAPPPAAEPSLGPVGPAALGVPSVPTAVQSLLGSDVTTELQRMRQAVEAATGKPVEPRLRLDQREEEAETKLKMTDQLREGLMHPENQKHLLARTSLLSATMAEDGQVVLRAPSKQALKDAMGILARVAYHCQWGCNPIKVGLLLRDKPDKTVHTVVVRLAATSSRMSTQEGKVNQRVEKLRVGTDPQQCQIAVEPIAGISRKHFTISFEYDKGRCYIQDMSTNGTRLNGKRLPRPPYKHPMDARVRIFHGDELVLAVMPDGEELGYVVNLLELSG